VLDLSSISVQLPRFFLLLYVRLLASSIRNNILDVLTWLLFYHNISRTHCKADDHTLNAAYKTQHITTQKYHGHNLAKAAILALLSHYWEASSCKILEREASINVLEAVTLSPLNRRPQWPFPNICWNIYWISALQTQKQLKLQIDKDSQFHLSNPNFWRRKNMSSWCRCCRRVGEML
jgi:hypothetical protein